MDRPSPERGGRHSHVLDPGVRHCPHVCGGIQLNPGERGALARQRSHEGLLRQEIPLRLLRGETLVEAERRPPWSDYFQTGNRLLERFSVDMQER